MTYIYCSWMECVAWARLTRLVHTVLLVILGVGSASAQVPGSIAGQFSVNESGAATYSIALSLPPGTAGVLPTLSLHYSSSSPSGLLGQGWSIGGLSSITRCPASSAIDGYAGGVSLSTSDRYCLDGQRLIAVSGVYGANGTEYRTQIESFSRVMSHGQSGNGPSYFTAELRNGLRLELGASTDSKLSNTSTSVLTWNVNRVVDRNGNFYTVNYSRDTAQGTLEPLEVSYTGNTLTSLTPYNRIMFEYEPRTSAKRAHIGGEQFSITQRLRRISAFTEGAQAMLYTIAYDYDANLNEDRVVSIQQCAAVGECMPVTTFDWGTGSSTGAPFTSAPVLADFYPAQGYSSDTTHPIVTGDWNGDGRTDMARVWSGGVHFYRVDTNGVSFSMMPDLNDFGVSAGYSDTNAYPIITGDWNGDGKTDIGRVWNGGVHFKVSDQSGFTAISDINDFGINQGYWNTNTYPMIVGDWNGDGRSDVARVSDGGIRFYQSAGTSFTLSHTLPNLGPGAGYWNGYQYPLFTGDWNGDGRTDVARVWDGGVRFYVSTVNGFSHLTDLQAFGRTQGYWNIGTYPLLVGDWNGDGLSDIGRVWDGGVHFYLSTGTTFVLASHLPGLGPWSGFTNGDTYPIYTGDWNGDGRTDIARVSSNDVRYFVSRSNGFELIGTISDLAPAQGFTTGDHRPFVEGDWNGDGLSDIGRVGPNGVALYVRTMTETDRVIRIVDGLGKQIEVDYAPLTDNTVYVKNSTAQYPNVDIQQASDVVSSVRMSNGLGGFATQLYHYSGLVYDMARRDSKGFATIDVFDTATNITTTTLYHQVFPLENRTYWVERRLQDGTLIERTSNTWTSIASSLTTVLPVATQTLDEQFELDGTAVQHSLTTRAFDTFGNPVQSTVTRSDGSFETTDSSFTNDVGAWFIGQLSHIAVTTQGGGLAPPPAVTRTTSFSYDSVRGLLLRETVEPASTQFQVIKEYTHDQFGNIITKTIRGADFTTRTTSTTYDPFGRFAVQSIDPLGYAEQRTYDSRTGAIRSLTDANGLVTHRNYDGFSRPQLETRADGTQTQWEYQVADPSAPSDAAYRVHTVTSGARSSTVYFDMLGREVQSRTDGFEGRQVHVDRIYDERGNVTLISEPYFPGDPIYWTSTEYDLLSRSVRSTAPGNHQTVFTHSGLTTVITNPLGQTRAEVVDLEGRTVRVVDNLGGVLRIERDSQGRPLQIIDQLGNTTTFTYDLAGRKLTMNDPDTGLTRYTYNGLGELLTVTDGKNQTTSYSYDLLGRMLTRTSLDGIDSWTYDTAAHGTGKLATVSGLNGFQEHYVYDALGRIAQTSTTIGSNQFVSSETYDGLGRPDTFTYPSGYAIKRLYDGAGYLKAIVQLADRRTVWKAARRNARGQLEEQVFGNGRISRQQFNPVTGFLERIKTNTIQDLGFQFDAMGTLLHRVDNGRGLSESFGYDGLNRLTSSQVTGQQGITITYDEIGNITSRSDVGVYTYPMPGAARPHAVTGIGGVLNMHYGYDAVGNRISTSTGSIQYSISGKPTRISEGSASLQFDLNPADSRVEERIYHGTSLRERKQFAAGGLFERVESGATTSLVHYIRGSDGLVALKTTRIVAKPGSAAVSTDSMRYLHLDHLGSIQSITDEGGTLVEVNSFDSWGRKRDPLTWTPVPHVIKSTIDRGFTGHEQLDSVGLVHMNGRVYDPLIGRFVSADPLVQAPTDMQSYNRYSYVLNNPLSLTDPSGYFSFRSIRKWVMRTSRMLMRQAVTNAAVAIGHHLGGPLFAAYLGNFTNSLVHGNGLSRSYRAGFKNLWQNALHAHLDNVIGHGVGGSGGFSKYGPLALATAHAVADAGYAAATGGNTRSAFMSGFGGSLGADIGTQIGAPLFGADAAGYIGASLGGGSAAALGGGKFQDGAMRGAFIYLYNHSAEAFQRGVQRMYDPNDPWKNYSNPTVGNGTTAFEHSHSVDFLDTKAGQALAVSLLVGGDIGASLLTFANDVMVPIGSVLETYPSLRESTIGYATKRGGAVAGTLTGMVLDTAGHATLARSVQLRRFRDDMSRARQTFIDELAK